MRKKRAAWVGLKGRDHGKKTRKTRSLETTRPRESDSRGKAVTMGHQLREQRNDMNQGGKEKMLCQKREESVAGGRGNFGTHLCRTSFGTKGGLNLGGGGDVCKKKQSKKRGPQVVCDSGKKRRLRKGGKGGTPLGSPKIPLWDRESDQLNLNGKNV